MRDNYQAKRLTEIQTGNHIISRVVIDFAEDHEGKYQELHQDLKWSFTKPKLLLGRYQSSPYNLI